MPKLPGISRATAVRVFTKIGFRIAHEGKHTVSHSALAGRAPPLT
jgi:hypothetical protein